MPKVPIIDDEERAEIRRRLRQYQKAHGKMGVPKLFECMLFSLDLPDHYYLDLKSLQRFLRNDNRTTDEKVLRYRKFLDREAPAKAGEEFSSALGRLLRSRRLVPEHIVTASKETQINGETVTVAEKEYTFDEFYWRRPLIEYRGRYEVDVQPLGEGEGEVQAPPAAKRHVLLLPSAEEHSLKSIGLYPLAEEAADPDHILYHTESHEALFMKAGYGQFVLVNAGYAGVSFTIMEEIGSEERGAPIILRGTTLRTGEPGELAFSSHQLTLTQIAGPNLMPQGDGG
jgi:hypothetical protein